MVWWRNRAALSFEFVFFWLGFYFVFHLFTFIKNSKLFNIYNFIIIIIIFYKNNQAKLPFLPSFLKQEIITQHEKISRLYINKKTYINENENLCVCDKSCCFCCCCSKLPITRKSNYSYLILCVFLWLNCMFLFFCWGEGCFSSYHLYISTPKVVVYFLFLFFKFIYVILFKLEL